MEDKTFKMMIDNKEVTLEVIHTFTCNNKNYIIYTDNELDENDEIRMYASSYEIKDNNMVLNPLSDLEFDLVDKELEVLKNE